MRLLPSMTSAGVLCCCVVRQYWVLHRFSRLFSTYLIMRVLDYKQEDFQWHVSKEYRTRLWSEVKAIIGTNVIFSALHVLLCFYKSSYPSLRASAISICTGTNAAVGRENAVGTYVGKYLR